MSKGLRRIVLIAGLGLSLIVLPQHGKAGAYGDVPYDELSAFNRFELMMGIAEPSPRVTFFLKHVQGLYLDPLDIELTDLRQGELAKLLGYAIGESASELPLREMFDQAFKDDLERWIVRMMAVLGQPNDANEMWRAVQQAAYGFYDEEMASKYGRLQDHLADNAPTSIEEWFGGLSTAEKEWFLRDRAGDAGFQNDDGTPFTIAQFEAMSILLDAELERRGIPPELRRELVRGLAEGERPSIEE